MKVKRKILEIDEERCDGCGQCIPSCAEGALAIVDGKARVISDRLCDGLGACLGDCPNDALRLVERETEEFDEAAVERHLADRPADVKKPTAGGRTCPSATIQAFAPTGDGAAPSTAEASGGSRLAHWPVQIHLVPADAPFLKGADLLVTADCAPLAHPRFHETFLAGRAVMMGCPKFDDVDAYLEKFPQIFATAGIRSITAVYMEVPCCSALPGIIRKAMAAAGKAIPFEEVVLGRRGDILERREAVVERK